MIRQRAREMLHHAGLKCTPGRVAMLSVLLEADRALSQAEILERLEGTGLNRVSVYRGLHAFTEAGLAHRVEAGDRLWRFGTCTCGSHVHCHPHFTCRGCGQVECLNSVSLPAMEPLAGYRIEEQEIYIRGLCPRCAEGSKGVLR